MDETPQLGAPQDGPQARSSIYSRDATKGSATVAALAAGATVETIAGAATVAGEAAGVISDVAVGTAIVD